MSNSASSSNSKDKILEKLEKVVQFAMDVDLATSKQSDEEYPDVLIPEEVMTAIKFFEEYREKESISQKRMREINQIYHKLQRKKSQAEEDSGKVESV